MQQRLVFEKTALYSYLAVKLDGWRFRSHTSQNLVACLWVHAIAPAYGIFCRVHKVGLLSVHFFRSDLCNKYGKNRISHCPMIGDGSLPETVPY